MHIKRQPLHCLQCQHDWVGELVMDAPIKVVCASIEALSCPNCDADSKSIAINFGATAPPVIEPVVAEAVPT